MATAKIAVVGDILMWRRQINAAQEAGNRYSFDSVFKEVAPYLQNADLTIGNLETLFAGREKEYQLHHPKTHYPMFNCPDELAKTLRAAGFRVLTTANNHCLDRGVAGLKRTLDILDRHDIKHTGTYRTSDEAREDLILDVQGCKIGILAYTYGTNVKTIPSQELWRVNRINDTMLQRIHDLKKQVDMVIVYLHFGSEFQRRPNETQRSWVTKCFQHGADVVLGAHPHVLQRMGVRKVRDIEGVMKERFIIYSLGNFVSGTMNKMPRTVSSVILNITISKDERGETRVVGVDYIPTMVYESQKDGRASYVVLPIGSRLRDPAKLPSPAVKVLKKVWADTTALLGGTAR